METYQRTLGALSDPTRRSILERLRERPLSVAELAEGLPVSRPAVSQHLKVLHASHLVAYEPAGTRNVYRVDTTGLAALRGWLDDFWGTALDHYSDFVKEQS